MSRIDEALRRASGKSTAGIGSILAPVTAENAAADAALWDFPEEGEAPPPALEPTPLTQPRSLDLAPAAEIVQERSSVTSEPPVKAAVPTPPPAPPVPPAIVETSIVQAAAPPIVAPPAAPAPAAAPSPATAVPVATVPKAAAAIAKVASGSTVNKTPAAGNKPVVAAKPTAKGRIADSVRVLLAGAETLVTGTHRKDAVEQYRKLAATLYNVQANRNVRVLLCTSAVMAEGKTVTAANLALTLSQSYQRRVLLIDADLRRPRLHTLFDIPNADGLYEALGAKTDRKVTVVPVSPWLSIVTAGRPGPDPVHVLTSERLSRVLEDAGANFDWVIIDTPPVLVLPDAGLLMGLVDGAVLVIGAGQTTYRMAKRAVDALGRDRIVGVVMNRAEDGELHEGYGGYYGYYDSSTRLE